MAKAGTVPETEPRGGPSLTVRPRSVRSLDFLKGDATLASASQTYRLAIAVLVESVAFWATILELLRSGFSPEQFNIAVLDSRLTDVATTPQPVAEGSPRLASLTNHLEPTRIHGQRALVTPGPLTKALLPNMDDPSSDADHAGSISSTLRSDLIRHVLDGAIVLCVNAANAAQQSASTRILLQHSSYRVQTHEFTITR